MAVVYRGPLAPDLRVCGGINTGSCILDPLACIDDRQPAADRFAGCTEFLHRVFHDESGRLWPGYSRQNAGCSPGRPNLPSARRTGRDGAVIRFNHYQLSAWRCGAVRRLAGERHQRAARSSCADWPGPQGGLLAPACLVAVGASGGAGARQCSPVRRHDQSRHSWPVENSASDFAHAAMGHSDHGGRSIQCVLWRTDGSDAKQCQTVTGVFINQPDRFFAVSGGPELAPARAALRDCRHPDAIRRASWPGQRHTVSGSRPFQTPHPDSVVTGSAGRASTDNCSVNRWPSADLRRSGEK